MAGGETEKDEDEEKLRWEKESQRWMSIEEEQKSQYEDERCKKKMWEMWKMEDRKVGKKERAKGTKGGEGKHEG